MIRLLSAQPLPFAVRACLVVLSGTALLAAADVGPSTTPGALPISLATLLPDMRDLAQLAEFPHPSYVVHQSSSRRVPPPKGLSKSAGGNYLRIDQRHGSPEYVLMEDDGPGVITLISIAKTFELDYQGVLRIYIDDMETPAIQGPMVDLFSGTHPGLPYPITAHDCNCWNLYLPMAYARRCRVASDDKMLFYHVVSRSYPTTTPITSFSVAELTQHTAAVTALAATVIHPDAPTAPGRGATTTPFTVEIVPGATQVIAQYRGTSSIRHIRIQGPPSTDRDDTALRHCLVQMMCDNETTIASPLPDFFGSAPGINAYQSLPCGVAKDGWMDSRWVMPFQSFATLAVTNHGTTAMRLQGEITTADYTWTTNTMHFHATWHQELDVPTVPAHLWSYLNASGRGVFVGSAFSIDNPLPAWWGEGAERIWVDGESSPSLFGTGSEDYYGFGFCSPSLFMHPYHGQTRCDGPANYGRTNLYRFTILDRIPFTTHFRFDMELMHWKDCLVDMSVIDYWYALPGATHDGPPMAATGPELRPAIPFKPFHAPGAIEAEGMRLIRVPGTTDIQPGWGAVGDGRYLRWSPSTVGDTLVLGFDVATAGNYRIIGHFLKGTGFGSIQIAFNGMRREDTIDLAADAFYPDPSGEMDLGVFPLTAGGNRCDVTCVRGSTAGATPTRVGVDYIVPLLLK